MAIFNNKNLGSDDLFTDVCEGYDVANGGAYDAIMESCDDDFAIIEAMHAFDMAEFEALDESGAVLEASVPVMEASLKEIWERIKTFFANLGKRIVAFFKSVGDFIGSIVMSGDTFHKKYGNTLNNLKFEKFPYEMYEYNIAKSFDDGERYVRGTTVTIGNLMDKIKELNLDDSNVNRKIYDMKEEIEDKSSTAISVLRKNLAGTDDKEKYSDALFKLFRKGGNKKSIQITDISPFLKYLEGSKGLLETIKKANKMVIDTFNAINKKINETAKAAEKADKNGTVQYGAKQAALMRSTLKAFSVVQTLFTTYTSAWSGAAKEAIGTYKSICFKAMQHKKA